MKRSMTLNGVALLSLVIASTWSSLASAQDVGSDLAIVRAELDGLRAEERERRLRIDALEQRLQAMEVAAGLMDTDRVSDSEQATMRGRNATFRTRGVYFGPDVVAVYGQDTAPPAQAQTTPILTQNEQTDPVRRAPATSQAVETVTQQEQGLFGERLSFEVGSGYAHFDDARLNLSGFLALDAIFLGRISVEEITGDVVTADGSIRYRIGDRMQIDANVPYLYRRSNFQSGGAGGNAAGLSERAVTDHGLGDISAGVSYRVRRETQYWPDVVVNARIKAPTGRDPFGVEVFEVPGTEGNLAVPSELSTGTGVWSGSIGVSALKTLDPLVLFGNLSYFYSPETDFDDLDEAEGAQPGSVDLGEAFQYGAGVAFALNDRSSLSLSFSQRFVSRTTLKREGGERRAVVGSRANVAAFNVGASFAINRRVSLLTTLGIGLTSDAPDMLLSVRVPFSF